MLKHEKDVFYIIYPTWLEGMYKYKWSDLPAALAQEGDEVFVDGLSSRNHTVLANNPGTYCISGSSGGGIIIRTPHTPWLAGSILYLGAGQLMSPDYFVSNRSLFPTQVAYLCPYPGVANEVVFGVKGRCYDCMINFARWNHAEGRVFWLIESDEKLSLDCETEINRLLAGSEVSVGEIKDPPPSALTSISATIRVRKHCKWFEIVNNGEFAGWQISTMIYCAFYLKRKSKKVIRVSLVADADL